ncbi:MAG: hypothetical protein WCF77_00795 [Minisyncoccia bacterium]|jgi:hypothetical protein
MGPLGEEKFDTERERRKQDLLQEILNDYIARGNLSLNQGSEWKNTYDETRSSEATMETLIREGYFQDKKEIEAALDEKHGEWRAKIGKE